MPVEHLTGKGNICCLPGMNQLLLTGKERPGGDGKAQKGWQRFLALPAAPWNILGHLPSPLCAFPCQELLGAVPLCSAHIAPRLQGALHT